MTTEQAELIYGMLTQRLYLRSDDPERDLVIAARNAVWTLTTACAEMALAVEELGIDLDVSTQAPAA